MQTQTMSKKNTYQVRKKFEFIPNPFREAVGHNFLSPAGSENTGASYLYRSDGTMYLKGRRSEEVFCGIQMFAYFV